MQDYADQQSSRFGRVRPECNVGDMQRSGIANVSRSEFGRSNAWRRTDSMRRRHDNLEHSGGI